jgi:TolB-like protein
VTSPTEDAVRAHVSSILSSTGFANAERMSRFLQYTVEMKLRGEEGQIKEFLLGREVFDRGADYDPRLDPIVRVEARRLRQRLAEYYEGAGRTTPLRIGFPKGSYAPVIQVASAPAPREIRWKPIALAAGLVLFLAGLAASLLLRPDQPAVAVVPARWVWGDTALLDPVDEALAESVIAQLANRNRIPVVGWPLVARHRGGAPLDLRALGRDLGVNKVMLVSVRREAGRLRVTVFNLRTDTGRKDEVQEFVADHLDTPAARDRLAAEISLALDN